MWVYTIVELIETYAYVDVYIGGTDRNLYLCGCMIGKTDRNLYFYGCIHWFNWQNLTGHGSHRNLQHCGCIHQGHWQKLIYTSIGVYNRYNEANRAVVYYSQCWDY